MILDWVPAHFPTDAHGLAHFDGTRALRARRPARGVPPGLEHRDLQFRPQRGARLPDRQRAATGWSTTTSTGCASMRWPRCSTATIRARPGEWIPNRYGGRENLEAVDFLRELNDAVAERCPGAMMIAEESHRLAGRDRARRAGGLGFPFKWNMGWMHDTLRYIEQDPIHRTLPPQRHDLRPALCLLRELRAAAVATTRWCTARARCSARCRATTGSSSPICAPISASCGPIPARSCCSWAASSPSGPNGTTTRAGLAPAGRPAPRGVQRLVRDLNALYRGSRRCTGATPSPRASVDRGDDARQQRLRLAALRRGRATAGTGGLQLHAGAAPRLPHRRAAGRALARGR